MNQELRIVKDDAKSISRIFWFDGETKTHIGDITFGTNEFTVCPDLASPQGIIPQLARLTGIFSDALNVWAEQNPIDQDFLLINVLFL